MNLCVVGWYYTPDFYVDLYLRALHHPVCVIQHQPARVECLPKLNTPAFYSAHEYPNIGLEFGAYDQYLQHHWDRVSPVLFIQDDTIIHDQNVWDQIEMLGSHGIQMAYIFQSEYEEIAMGGAHGRAIYCSAEFLTQLKAHGGFPYDGTNTGTITGGSENFGIQAFMLAVKRIGNMGVGTAAIIPGIQHGRRGVLSGHQPYFYDRTTRGWCTMLDGTQSELMISGRR